jgi:hypothetical protein
MMTAEPPRLPPTGPALWRIPLCDESPSAVVVTASPGPTARDGPGFFCLHLRTAPSIAGLACQDCGSIVAAVVEGVTRPPITSDPPLDVVDAAAGAMPVSETPAARQEWERHVSTVEDQPFEVIQHAWVIFQQVYVRRGAVSGNKARALVLVSLLYSNRLLHGSNHGNEEYLIRRLAISTRNMNKAFTQMASVTLPLHGASVASC